MNINTNEILNICNEFLEIPSTVGFEKPFLNYLNNRAKKLGLITKLEKNYLYLQSNLNSDKLFSVHIDRQGFILNDTGEIEYATNLLKKKLNLKFRREEQNFNEKKLKDILNKKLTNKNEETVFLDNYFLRFKFKEFQLNFFRQDGPVDIEKIALRYVGENIISYDSISGKKFNEYKIERYDLDWKEHKAIFSIDKKISIKNKVFMLKSKIKKFKKMFSAQIDNVISAAVLFYLLENSEKFNFDANIIFTCGEEMGESYKSIIDFYNKDNFEKKFDLIVLDTSPYYDFNGKEEGFLVLRHGDERSGFNKNLVNNLIKFLELEKISFDFKPSFLGRTELGKVTLKTNGKINGVTLQLPSLNYHTTYETSTIKSLENYTKSINKIGIKNKN